MAYSVDWPTQVVTIPKTDLVQISMDPEIYVLDVLIFWSQLHGIQQGEGMTYDTIMRSNAPVTLSGTVDARVVEIINNYKIEIEDGPYQVNLINAKSNILDVRIQNQVSINNLAGIIVSGGGGGDGSYANTDRARDDLMAIQVNDIHAHTTNKNP